MSRFFLLSLLLITVLAAHGQHISYVTEDIVCYASEQTFRTKTGYEHDLEHLGNRLEADNPFLISYFDVPSAARTTINRATEIWAELIKTDIPIKLSITWVSLSDGVLGSARPASYEANFAGAPIRNIAYPIALAERLARQELNDSTDFEIFINLNKEYTWHYNFDEPIAENTHDLLSVVLHEIGHGLGLADSYSVSGDVGTWGTNSRANIYDYHIANDEQEQLISTFNNFSNDLFRQLTSNKLVYLADLPFAANLDEYPGIYAPSEFNGGSSISHLDESSFPAGDQNSLMTPQLGREEVIHRTGPIIKAILADMGYVYTFIEHDSVPDQSNEFQDVTLTGRIYADSSLVPEEALLIYSFDDFATEQEVILTIEGDAYTAVIPAPGIKAKVAFYYAVKDVNNLVFREPTAAAQKNYEFSFGLVTDIDSKEPFSQQEVSIYPNPAVNEITILGIENLGSCQVTISNSVGKKVFHRKVSGDQVIPLNVEQGLYIVSINSEGYHSTFRLIIK